MSRFGALGLPRPPGPYIQRHGRRRRESAEGPLRIAALLAIGAAVAAICFIFSGVVAGAGVLLTVAVAVLLWQPAPAEPQPTLVLHAQEPIDRWPSRKVAEIFAAARGEDPPAPPSPPPPASARIEWGRQRPLDLDAIREDAMAGARRSAPGTGALNSMIYGAMGMYAQPTEEDRRRFAELVEEYGEEMEDWLAEAAAAFSGRVATLVTSVETSNPAQVDAEDALVLLRFPPGFEPAETTVDLAEQPGRPSFLLRRSPLAAITEPRWANPVRAQIYTVPSIRIPDTASMARTFFEPSYRKTGGGLEVRYPRNKIRHGEVDGPGEELRVRCTNPGTHTIAWEIHAGNLPKARTGTITVAYLEEEDGEPVKTLADLDNLLALLGLVEPEESGDDADE